MGRCHGCLQSERQSHSPRENHKKAGQNDQGDDGGMQQDNGTADQPMQPDDNGTQQMQQDQSGEDQPMQDDNGGTMDDAPGDDSSGDDSGY